MTERIGECLRRIADGDGDEGFAVVYSDMHGLWGGVTITLAGGGECERTRRGPGGEPQVARGRAGPERVAAVARLLLDVEAWQQRTPERAPVPDESRATLTVRCGGATFAIWEGYNDLAANGRMILVRDHLARLADETVSGTAPD